MSHLDIIRSKLEEALQGNVCLKHPFAVVLETRSGKLITGHNGPLPKEGKHERCLREEYEKSGTRHPPTSHGEISALCKAARIGEATEDGIMWLSDWLPCYRPCSVALVESHIKRVVTSEQAYEDITRHILVEKLRNHALYEFERSEETLRLNNVEIFVEPRIRPFYSLPIL